MKRLTKIVMAAAGILTAATMIPEISCGRSDTGSGTLPDTLHVATLYGPASFFYYRDSIMGYDHDLMELLAGDHGHKVDWMIVNSMEEAVEKIKSGEAMVIAAPIPVDSKYKDDLTFCGPETHIEQVLVQPPGDTVVVDVNQLAGRVVYVEKDSKGAEELEKLNEKIGGTIKVRPIDPDSIATEDMLASVAHGDIHLAVVDRYTARLNKSYFPELNITLALTPPEVARWGVGKNKKWLADTLDRWGKEPHSIEVEPEILKKYFDAPKNFPVEGAGYDRKFENGYASPYDSLFKTHADGSGWDWRMLAAQAYTESRFRPDVKSWAGARGLMQIMPKTGRQFGLKANEMNDPSRSIETGIKVLDAYDAMLADKVPNPIERKKFTLAAYNAGPGHVFDAINLAKKYGYDPEVWNDNVEKAMLMKMNKKYYRDPVVKYGYSRGRETVAYVKHIYNYYDEVKEKIPY